MRCKSLIAIILLVPSVLLAADAGPRRSAFLQSLVLPGWGQYSLGKKNSALTFLGVELILVGGMYTFHAYGESARDEYKAMAANYAGVIGDHPHDFYVDVGNWMSVEEYNAQRLRERNFGDLYVFESDFWQWDSDQHRAEMRTRRIKSDQAFNSALYLIGGLVLNHIAAAIHAGRASARENEDVASATPAMPWSFSLKPATTDGGIRISLARML